MNLKSGRDFASGMASFSQGQNDSNYPVSAPSLAIRPTCSARLGLRRGIPITLHVW